jgi:NACHT domain
MASLRVAVLRSGILVRMPDIGLSLGAAAVKIACKIWLRDNGAAADASVEITDILKDRIADERDRRKVQRQFDMLEETVADRITRVLGHEFRGLDAGEREAAVWLVHGSLQRARLSEGDLLHADLDPVYLERQVRRGDRSATRDLSEVGTALYDRLLAECCTDVIEIATALPEFGPAAFTEILRRETLLVGMVRDLLDRVPARDVTTLRETAEEEFAAAYRRHVVNRLDRLRLFGITPAPRRYPLSVAYISLSMTPSQRQGGALLEESARFTGSLAGQDRKFRSTVRVEHVLSGSTRLLIRGDAGSGKTTLLQWLAVRTARYDFDDPLTPWTGLIPFFIPLRNYADRPLPVPAEFAGQISPHMGEKMPPGWAAELLDSGLALVLIDGVDELPARQRAAARRWLGALVDDFPRARYVVTSRPAAVSEQWLEPYDFLVSSLEPMSPADVTKFVGKWHEAVRSEIADSAESAELTRCEARLHAALGSGRRLRQLATSPLMCALLCALHRDRRTQLPDDRIEIYDAALEMLLERRDAERGVNEDIAMLSRRRKMFILQTLAYWLLNNGWSNGSRERGAERVADCISTMPDVSAAPEVVLQSLLERSGVVREPVPGRVDFVHRSFQDYLAARAIVDAGDLGVLTQHASDDSWQEVVVLAVAYAGSAVREELLTDLLRLARAAPKDRRALLHIVALACLEAAPQIPQGPRMEIEREAAELMPPATTAQAEAVARAGEFGLDLLMRQPIGSARAAVAAIRAASLIGGPDALRLIQACAGYSGAAVSAELIRAWSRFDPVPYARDVLSARTFQSVSISDPATLPALRHVSCRKLELSFPRGHGDIASFEFPRGMEDLTIQDRALTGITPVLQCPALRSLTLRETGSIDIGPLRSCAGLRHLSLNALFVPELVALMFLEQLTSLEMSELGSFAFIRNLLPTSSRLSRFSMPNAHEITSRELQSMHEEPCLQNLKFLVLAQCRGLRSAEGIQAWRQTLTAACLQAPQLDDHEQISELTGLEYLNLRHVPVTDLSFLTSLDRLKVLHLGGTSPLPALRPLTELPKLAALYLWGSHETDLAPLRSHTGLRVYVRGHPVPPGA